MRSFLNLLRYCTVLAVILSLTAPVSAATPQNIAAEYVATVKLTQVDSATLSKMGSDFSEAQFRQMVEGTFDPFVIKAKGGKGIQVRIENDATANGTISENTIQFAVVLDPQVRLVYSGTFNATLTRANGTMFLKTPAGKLAKGVWNITRKGPAPVRSDPADNPAEDAPEEDAPVEDDADNGQPVSDTNPSETDNETANADAGDSDVDNDVVPENNDTGATSAQADGDPAVADASLTHSTFTDEEFWEIVALMSDAAPKEDPPKEIPEPFEEVNTGVTTDAMEKNADQVTNVQKTLEQIAAKNPSIELKRDLANRPILTDTTQDDSLKGKVVKKVEDSVIDKIVSWIPFSEYFKNTVSGVLKDKKDGKEVDALKVTTDVIDEAKGTLADKGLEAAGLGGTKATVVKAVVNSLKTKDQQCKERADRLKFDNDESRLSCTMDKFDENIGPLRIVKDVVQENLGWVGKKVGGLLDSMGDKKRKMVAKAAATEYRLFKEAYINAKKKPPTNQGYLSPKKRRQLALKAALAALNNYKNNEENDYQRSTDKIGSYFSSDKNAVDHTLLQRDTDYKSIRSRAATYVRLLREDKLL